MGGQNLTPTVQPCYVRVHVNNRPQPLPLRSWAVYVTTSCKHISFFVKYWLPILTYFNNNKQNKAENQTEKQNKCRAI